MAALRGAWKAFHPAAWLSWDITHRGSRPVVGLTFGIEGLGAIAHERICAEQLVRLLDDCKSAGRAVDADSIYVLREPMEIASAKMTARYVPSGRAEPTRPRRAVVEEFLAGFSKR